MSLQMPRSTSRRSAPPSSGPLIRKDMDFLSGVMAKRDNLTVTSATTSKLRDKFKSQFRGLANRPTPRRVEQAKDQLSAARNVIGSMRMGEAKLQLHLMVNTLEAWVERSRRHRSRRIPTD